jgi:hypothetical protein
VNKFLILLFIMMSSCIFNNSKNNLKNDINFFEQLSFQAYKLKLEDYSKNKPYPNIDD